LHERLCWRSGVRLDLRFQRDRGIGQIAVLESLFGGIRGGWRE
jgi:hypothetical protein